jgi:hypothetical protein
MTCWLDSAKDGQKRPCPAFTQTDFNQQMILLCQLVQPVFLGSEFKIAAKH